MHKESQQKPTKSRPFDEGNGYVTMETSHLTKKTDSDIWEAIIWRGK